MTINTSRHPKNNKRLLFLFPHPVTDYFEKVKSREIPSERLYGVIELKENGWDVVIADSRFNGLSGWLLKKIKPFSFNLIDIKTILAIKNCDIVVVKDDFSIMATLAAKLFNKKIIYYDSMFAIPHRWWKSILIRLNMRLADKMLAYSDAQIMLWSQYFKISLNKFIKIKYTIDTDFYYIDSNERSDNPYILSVGRDMGRDFHVLAESLSGTNIGLKLVTLPYLVRGLKEKYPWVDIYERLSYKELFSLYSRATIVVIPLKEGLMYPSGIRGVLESMALGKSTICTYTPILDEQLVDKEEIIFVPACDSDALKASIKLLLENEESSKLLESKGQFAVKERFGMSKLTCTLEDILNSL